MGSTWSWEEGEVGEEEEEGEEVVVVAVAEEVEGAQDLLLRQSPRHHK